MLNDSSQLKFQLRIASLEDVIFAVDMADEFKAVGIINESTGSGTTEGYSEQRPLKISFLQRLKKRHPLTYKGLVIAATVFTLGLAGFAAYSYDQPIKEKAKINWNAMSKDIPSFYNIDLSNDGIVTLRTYDLSFNKNQISMDFYGPSGHMTGSGPKIGSYLFKEKMIQNSEITEISSKEFITTLNKKSLEILTSNSCTMILDILCNNIKYSEVFLEIETFPGNIISKTEISFYKKDGDYWFHSFLNTINPHNNKNILYKYSISNMSGVNTHYWGDYLQGMDNSSGGIDINMDLGGVLDPNMFYILNIVFRESMTNNDAGENIRLGHIAGIPIVPKLIY